MLPEPATCEQDPNTGSRVCLSVLHRRTKCTLIQSAVLKRRADLAMSVKSRNFPVQSGGHESQVIGRLIEIHTHLCARSAVIALLANLAEQRMLRQAITYGGMLFQTSSHCPEFPLSVTPENPGFMVLRVSWGEHLS